MSAGYFVCILTWYSQVCRAAGKHYMIFACLSGTLYPFLFGICMSVEHVVNMFMWCPHVCGALCVKFMSYSHVCGISCIGGTFCTFLYGTRMSGQHFVCAFCGICMSG